MSVYKFAESEVKSVLQLRAHPHQWGPGLIHIFDRDSRKTFCGKTRDVCSGDLGAGSMDEITYKVCLKSFQTRAEHARLSEQWKREAEEREALKRKEQIEWWNAYNLYLQSADWKDKRSLVLERAKGVCEGCGEERAVQVHHLWYPPKGCRPGSEEWIRLEKLFQMVAVCKQCHQDLHPA